MHSVYKNFLQLIDSDDEDSINIAIDEMVDYHLCNVERILSNVSSTVELGVLSPLRYGLSCGYELLEEKISAS